MESKTWRMHILETESRGGNKWSCDERDVRGSGRIRRGRKRRLVMRTGKWGKEGVRGGKSTKFGSLTKGNR